MKPSRWTMPLPQTEILLASPRGFCAGVERAIEIVERALDQYGAPVYVKHAIVHNRHVVERLENMGAVFVEELSQVPSGAHVVFSAHGVSPAVRQEAVGHSHQVLDATCPLVTKVHMEAVQYAKADRTILLIGHKNHVEVQGTLGEAPRHTQVVETVEDALNVRVENPDKVSYLTQTTLSLDDTARIVESLKTRFPALQSPRREDICYATQNRQTAVKALAREADLILVVGSAHSSNSNRLVEVARSSGVESHLLESLDSLEKGWLAGKQKIGITAGASAPEDVVRGLVDHLASQLKASIRELVVIQEDVTFPLPAILAEPRKTGS